MADVLTHNQDYKSPQEALLHFGVKGMKWGVRNDKTSNGELSTKKQEKRDVKLGQLNAQIAKTDVRIRELQSGIAAHPKGTGVKNAYIRSDLTNQLDQTQAYRDHLEKTAKAVESGRLTPTQKRLLVGGAIVGGLVIYSAYNAKVQTGEVNSLKLRGKAALQRRPFDFNRNDEWAGPKTPDEALALSKGINPNYSAPGGQMNCRRCTFSYELRRRGYDVTATASSIGAGESESGMINALTPGKSNVSKLTSLSSMTVSGAKGIRTQVIGDTRSNPAIKTSVANGLDRTSLLSALSTQPSGARGEAVFNFGAFGHSLAYERFGDKTYIFDTQKGKRYDLDSPDEYKAFVDKWTFGGGLKNVEITRLDNVDLDNVFLSRWATNRKKG